MNFRRTTTTTVLVALVAVAVGAGCGGDGDEDRLSQAQTTEEVNRAVQTVNGEFQQVFEQLGRRGEDERVPAGVRNRLRAVAEIERNAAGDVDSIQPAVGTGAAIDRFVRAARAQADALESAAGRRDLTVAEMADVVELPDMRGALDELKRQGLADVPEQQ